MPTRAAHHRPPPPPASTHTHHAAHASHAAHTTPTAATAAPPPAVLRDTSPTPPAAAHVHADGFDHAPRAPYGVRLGDEHLTLRPAPDLTVHDVPRAPASTPTPHADATPSLMERGISTFPLADAIPGFTSFPTFSPSTSAAHDGSPSSHVETSRAAARADEHGRAPPPLAPPTLPDRAREEAEHAVTESIERGAFCASPAGDVSPDCAPR